MDGREAWLSSPPIEARIRDVHHHELHPAASGRRTPGDEGRRPARPAGPGRAPRLGAALACVVVFALGAPPAGAAPKPKPHSGQYNLDILGFNEGEPYRLEGAEAEAVLGDPGAALFRFDSANWMLDKQPGGFVKLAGVVGRFPERPATDLVAVYQLDLDGDGTAEMLLIPGAALADGRERYAPTLLELGREVYKAVWSPTELKGARYRLVDVRDLNGDGRAEIVLSGESGKSGFYQFFELVGKGKAGFRSLQVDHVDSLHYVDLDSDGRIEVVVRERVGRKGPAYQWTYVDHLHRWTGRRFVAADEDFPRYHDEETLPTLLGDLIDHFDAKRPILEEKVEAIEAVRRQVLGWSNRPWKFHSKKVKALRALKRKRFSKARSKLEALVAAYPYDAQVLIGLAQVYAQQADWERALDAAIRALTVEPRSRQGWWWSAVAFSQLSERSSAVASLHNAVTLCGPRDEGIAFLKARRAEPGMAAPLQQAIDTALRELASR